MKIKVYLVMNWQIPVAVFDDPVNVVSFLRSFMKDWPSPVPPGAISVYYAWVSDKWDLFDDPRDFENITEDVTGSFLKAVNHG